MLTLNTHHSHFLQNTELLWHPEFEVVPMIARSLAPDLWHVHRRFDAACPRAFTGCPVVAHSFIPQRFTPGQIHMPFEAKGVGAVLKKALLQGIKWKQANSALNGQMHNYQLTFCCLDKESVRRCNKLNALPWITQQ